MGGRGRSDATQSFAVGWLTLAVLLGCITAVGESLPVEQAAAPMVRAECSHGQCANEFIVLLDMWERLVNFRSGLIHMMYASMDAGFVVVAPFVHQTKVSRMFSLPHHFLERRMKVTPLDTYFDVDTVRHIVPVADFEDWAGRTKKFLRGNEWRVVSVVSALVKFGYSGITISNGTEPYAWCDDADVENDVGIRNRRGQIEHLDAGKYRALTKHVVYERIVCVDGRTVSGESITKEHFRKLFQFVRDGVSDPDMPITLAFGNYRKEAYVEYAYRTAKTLAPKFNSKNILSDSLGLSKLAYTQADRFIESKMGGSPAYIAVHFRAGKTMDRVQTSDFSGEYFKQWGEWCLRQLHEEVQKIQREHPDTNFSFYVATDLLNDGMRGGEAPRGLAIAAVLKALHENLFSYFPGAATLDSNTDLHDVGADTMGMASLTDLSMSVKATHFVSQLDSFSKMVGWERQRLNLSPSHIRGCAHSIQDARERRYDFPPARA
ncbi:hypothetical protein FVE85_3201 [Porphyridium purpureum]|uniref:O-fucosyltransferase family protein n=1 Tax=Porphyridium purpureum TaxID=35688 RepID=A0A5J4YVL7_PORPP|nr:hypothetical protein FVE85_3201 [Porphyridium purpureum]|eukprot:POR2035..scf227_4